MSKVLHTLRTDDPQTNLGFNKIVAALRELDTRVTTIIKTVNNFISNPWTFPGWTYPTLLNGFLPYNYGNTYRPAGVAYYKDSNSRVWMDGWCYSPAGAAANTVMFNLPAGYRPKYYETLPVVYNGSLLGATTLLPNGNMIIIGAVGAGFVINFTSFTFLAEQ